MIVRRASHRSEDGWSARHLALSVAAVVAAVWLCRAGHHVGPLAAIWFANAIELGILILVPRRLLFCYAATLAVANGLTVLATGPSVTDTVSGTTIDTVVLLVAAAVIRRDRAWVDGSTERIGSWLRFTVGGVLLPFLFGAALQAVGWELSGGGRPDRDLAWSTALTYFATNVLAALLLVPVLLRLRPAHLRRARPVPGLEPAGLLVLLAVLAAGALTMPQPVLLFLLPVPLIVLAIRHGAVGAASAALVLVPIAIGTTSAGLGPFVVVARGDEGVGLLWAQLFLILLMVADYTILALLDGSRPSPAGPDDRSGVFRLLAENSSDFIALIDPEGRLEYISPDVVANLGMSQADLIGNPWVAPVHPDDRPAADATAAALQAGADSASCVCRIRIREDTWRWVDIQFWARRSTPSDRRVVAVAQDVTAERRRQRELEQQNLELAAAAGTDPLTGLPNRRHLAHAMATARTSAVIGGTPLSLLVIDIDHFKAYNDRYGHAGGDRAIVAVADAVRAALRRPDDLAARYGGEEFVVLLPRTDATGALRVAESLRERVRACRPDTGDGGAGLLTVSVGVATSDPPHHTDDADLFARSDAALYRAKQRGRDRVEAAAPAPTTDATPDPGSALHGTPPPDPAA